MGEGLEGAVLGPGVLRGAGATSSTSASTSGTTSSDSATLSGRAGRRFQAGHTLDLSYSRSVYRVADTRESRNTQWLRLSGRAELGHGVYLLGDLEYDQGDDLKGPRAFVELGYQF